MEHAEPHAARAEHRVGLGERVHAVERVLELLELVALLDPGAFDLLSQLLRVGDELVQRRVEQPDRHRQPGHRLEEPFEVVLLEREQPVERLLALLVGLDHDHLLHAHLVLGAQEDVLAATQADPLGAELAGAGGVLGGVGVRAHAQRPQLVGPLEHGLEVVAHLGLLQLHVVGGDRVPVLPSMASRSPSESSVSPTLSRFAWRSMSSSPAPATQGLPIPRATSAAWLALPPLLVRIPSAAWKPAMSSASVKGARGSPRARRRPRPRRRRR